MDGWDVMETIFDFVIRNSTARVILKGEDEWKSVLAMRSRGAGIEMIVEGEAWTISMHDVKDIDLHLKM